MSRAAFTLGGLGSGFAHNKEELRELAAKALSTSPQLLIEKSIKGWKEVEYEVVRDAYDNSVTVCNMENFDPMGIHTGESIVVAPSQTLNNDEYHMLRTTAVKVVRHLGIIGECNIQYALDPNSLDYCIIEVNPRLSRSSALASKATGYPLAAVAAKLILGIELEQIPNAVTRCTMAAFEPSLDYIVVKFPKWDLAKFDRVSRKIGSQMRSVGEVMSIAREFPEAMQKAIRMINPGFRGFEPHGPKYEKDALLEELTAATDERIFAIADAFVNHGMSVQDVHDLTKIDNWYLSQLKVVSDLGEEARNWKLKEISQLQWMDLKRAGFSDKQIAQRLGVTEMEVRDQRKQRGVTPWVKQIDTLAAEFPAATNYLYMTYHGSEHDVEFDEHGWLVLGCGTYRIGSSVEFDFGSVWCMRSLREDNQKTIMLNCNPETVSTDFDECDRLYFEEVSLERSLDVIDLEAPKGVIASFGGQIPNNLAMPLHRAGVTISGTHPEMIDSAEDRHKHSAMLDEIGVDQPKWSELTSVEAAKEFANNHGYPVLVRPSYVLSGAAMNVVDNEEEMEEYLNMASDLSPDHPVVISKFMTGAREIDIDAIANKGELLAYSVAEHIENGGVHSGDATLVLPGRDIAPDVFNNCKDIAGKIAARLQISGPFNMQLLEQNGNLKVIETNVRGSRSLPFSSKVLGVDMVRLATSVIVGDTVDVDPRCDKQQQLPYVGVKVPQFSWKRLPGADPLLGVEMASTGEIACFHKDKWGAYLLGLQATHIRIPRPGEIILANLPQDLDTDHPGVLGLARLSKLGYKLHGMNSQGGPLARAGIDHTAVSDEEATNLVRDTEGGARLVVDLACTPDTYILRRDSVDFAKPLMVNGNQLLVLSEGIEKYKDDPYVLPFTPLESRKDTEDMVSYSTVFDSTQ
mmetsp:Transcript_70163/g.106136  ORF Transcript_70163/g.106136 Transcript_70163/m.106136 type:complete len:914 (+) Transcript_70163:3-2744(+)